MLQRYNKIYSVDGNNMATLTGAITNDLASYLEANLTYPSFTSVVSSKYGKLVDFKNGKYGGVFSETATTSIGYMVVSPYPASYSTIEIKGVYNIDTGKSEVGAEFIAGDGIFLLIRLYNPMTGATLSSASNFAFNIKDDTHDYFCGVNARGDIDLRVIETQSKNTNFNVNGYFNKDRQPANNILFAPIIIGNVVSDRFFNYFSVNGVTVPYYTDIVTPNGTFWVISNIFAVKKG